MSSIVSITSAQQKVVDKVSLTSAIIVVAIVTAIFASTIGFSKETLPLACFGVFAGSLGYFMGNAATTKWYLRQNQSRIPINPNANIIYGINNNQSFSKEPQGLS